ncbi:MFS general substrate transporter [Ascodesmis nigricans]|uniref:MFS general substrate transporter n=1 Tax=Ascodesmis nigricans TaxID=341454 RepID=A0A4S2MT32_9PEZI|nr:MFS general substrate transporter [Ascodesmis nigricans]
MSARRTASMIVEHGSANGDDAGIKQKGVAKAEAVAKTWTRRGLWLTYVGVLLMAFATSFGEQTNYALSAFATSSFSSHSLLSTIGVIGGVMNAVLQPPIAKFADVFGRTEGFIMAMAFYVVGYSLTAGSQNIVTFAIAKIFEALGITGLKMLQQVFIADTSDVLNRMIMGSLPDVPFLITVWIAPVVVGKMEWKWRWGFGMWAIITPIVSLPLIFTLWWHQRKAKHLLRSDLEYIAARNREKQLSSSQGVWRSIRSMVMSLDLVGAFILTAGFAMVLVPLTVAGSSKENWSKPGIIVSMVIGGLLLLVFPFWESSTRFAPTPLVTRRALTNPTVVCSCILSFFYFMAFFLSIQPYFLSYLLVTRPLSSSAGSYVLNTFSISCTISVLTAGFCVKKFKRYKRFLWGGIFVYTLGIGLLLHFRTAHVSQSVGWIVFSQALVGFGGGLVNGPAQLGLQASSSHQEVACNTALFLTTLSLGGAVGSAISGAIWAGGVKSRLIKYLPQLGATEVARIFGSIEVAREYKFGTAERAGIVLAYDETMRTLLIVAVCVCIPLWPCVWFMKDLDLEEVRRRDEVKGAVVVGSGGRGKVGKKVEEGEIVREK